MAGQAELLEVVDALDAAGSLARGLNRGQQQRDQDRDDRDDNQKFDQREAERTASSIMLTASCETTLRR